MRATEVLRGAPDEVAFPDADEFAVRARRHALFADGEQIVVARAPGRFDVLGGIADYAGGLVLELPIAPATLAAVQLADDGQVIAVSGRRRIAVATGLLLEAPLEELARRFAGRDAWAAYVLGPVALLVREERLPLAGLRLLIASSIPEAKGLASSAAVEIAAAHAVAGALGCRVEPRRLALLAQLAEQLVARAPCGPMDQVTAACGQAAHLLTLMCRPAEVIGSFALPSGVSVWGIDSGTRHAVGDGPYRQVRCATFMGKALLDCRTEYLSALQPSDVELDRLPERMTGAEFLRRHDGVEDGMSSVEPTVDYPVRAATLHPIEERVRVETFLEALDGSVTTRRARLLGEIMYASHASYSRCGLGLPVTDRIVEAVRVAGWGNGLIGARVSGGGSGGTVVVLGREEAEPVVRRISETFGAGLVGGTSAGAAEFGTRLV
jgi:galactokinase